MEQVEPIIGKLTGQVIGYAKYALKPDGRRTNRFQKVPSEQWPKDVDVEKIKQNKYVEKLIRTNFPEYTSLYIDPKATQLLTDLTQLVEDISTQGQFGGGEMRQVPKDLIKYMLFQAKVREVCDDLQKRQMPPTELLALAQLLGVKFDQKTTWPQACKKVRQAVQEMLQ